MPTMEIRPVRAQEWEAFRDLRLRALVDAPDAFRTTHDQAALRSDEEWVAITRSTAEHADMVSWIAIANDAHVGQAFSRIEEDEAALGIFGMWVAPEVRGTGVGKGLLEAAESWGRQRGCTTAVLSVTEGNAAAESLYRAAGYRPTGGSEPLRDGSPLKCAELAKEL